MTREEKQREVENLQAVFAAAPMVVVCRQSGMTVTESNALRRACGEAEASFKVSKNSLLRLAVQGTAYEHLSESFSGPTAIAWSQDPVAVARAVSDYSRVNNKLELVTGASKESTFDSNTIKYMASLPSLDDLRAKIIGLLTAPAGQLARLSLEVGTSIVRLISKKPDHNAE